MSESEREPQSYRTIIIVGGGCYGGYYVRQLDRAARAGAVNAERLLVVDHDPNCSVRPALENSAIPAELVVRDWREFFDDYLTTAAADPANHALDAIVPSPLMPHLMGEWLVKRARGRFDHVETKPFTQVPLVPWDRAGEPGTHYVSFATWMCPINCVEPRTCPHTREERTWSLPVRLAEHAAESRGGDSPVETAVLFCRHRAYGVGMFDTAEVIAADALIARAGEQGFADVIVGTVSHCHGALTRLVIGAPDIAPHARF